MKADLSLVPASPFGRSQSPQIFVEQLTSSMRASRSPGRDRARCALCGTALVPYGSSPVPKGAGNEVKGVPRSSSCGQIATVTASTGVWNAASSTLSISEPAVSVNATGAEVLGQFDEDEALLREEICAVQRKLEDAVAEWKRLQSGVSGVVRSGLHDLGVLKACVASDRCVMTDGSIVDQQLNRVEEAAHEVEAALRALVPSKSQGFGALGYVVSPDHLTLCGGDGIGGGAGGSSVEAARQSLRGFYGQDCTQTEIEILCDELREAQKTATECFGGCADPQAKPDQELEMRTERDIEIEACFRELEAAFNGLDLARSASTKVAEEMVIQNEAASQHFCALKAAEAQAAEETSHAMAETVEAVAVAAGHAAGVHDAAEVARHVRRQSLECEAARELAAAAARQLKLEQEEKLSALESCGSFCEESAVEEALLLATEACVRIQAILPPAQDVDDIEAEELVGDWPGVAAGRLSDLIQDGREAVLSLARQAILSRQLFLSEQQGKIQRELLAKSMLQKLADAQRQLKDNAAVLSRTTSRRGALTSPSTGVG